MASAVTVIYLIAGSATNGTDYVSIPGSIVIPALSTDVTIDVVVSDDVLVEGPETVTMKITSVTGSPSAIAAPANTVTVNIADDDIGVSIATSVTPGNESVGR